MSAPPENPQLEGEELEVRLFSEAVYQRYGYDFREYSKTSFRRRVLTAVRKSGCQTVSELQHRIIYDPRLFAKVLDSLTITVTEMFRDHEFYRSIRTEVVPHLKTYPEVKVWHAGCATGEEVYSMAILLKEEELYDRSIIYGTDINPAALKTAKEGILSLEAVKAASKHYFEAGGKSSFSDYYTTGYDAAILDGGLREHVVFADHNLVTDAGFGEMNLILCRNVLIYFNKPLQERALGMMWSSLRRGGFLCVGSRERLFGDKLFPDCEEFLPGQKIYRRKGTRV